MNDLEIATQLIEKHMHTWEHLSKEANRIMDKDQELRCKSIYTALKNLRDELVLVGQHL